MTKAADSWKPANLKRAVSKARRFPDNTCPASRHVEQLGFALCRKQPWVLTFHEEPEHCGASMLATVAALYRTRTALRELHRVCTGMDLENQMARPTEAEYQAAMRKAAKAIGLQPAHLLTSGK